MVITVRLTVRVGVGLVNCPSRLFNRKTGAALY